MEMCGIRSQLQYRKLVWLAAVEIAIQGVKPSEYRISQRLGSTIVLIKPEVRDAIKEARTRLGFSN